MKRGFRIPGFRILSGRKCHVGKHGPISCAFNSVGGSFDLHIPFPLIQSQKLLLYLTQMPAGSSSEETPQNCQKKIVKVLFLDSNFISTDNRKTITHIICDIWNHIEWSRYQICFNNSKFFFLRSKFEMYFLNLSGF